MARTFRHLALGTFPALTLAQLPVWLPCFRRPGPRLLSPIPRFLLQTVPTQVVTRTLHSGVPPMAVRLAREEAGQLRTGQARHHRQWEQLLQRAAERSNV